MQTYTEGGFKWVENWTTRKIARGSDFKSYLLRCVGTWVLATLVFGVVIRCIYWIGGRCKLIDSWSELLGLAMFLLVAGALRLGIEAVPRDVFLSSARIEVTGGNLYRARLNFTKLVAVEIVPITGSVTRLTFHKSGIRTPFLVLGSPFPPSDLAQWFRTKTEIGDVIEPNQNGAVV